MRRTIDMVIRMDLVIAMGPRDKDIQLEYGLDQINALISYLISMKITEGRKNNMIIFLYPLWK